MLVSLNVKNFAIIDNIEMDFSSGMTVLTGETGAGKSLIIDAISLLLGKRAQVEQVRHGEVKASITGVFSSLDDNIKVLLDDIGVDYDPTDNIIIKREIYASGKSVCKINSDIVSLSDLSKIGDLICDIHSQEDNFGLVNPKNYLSFLRNERIDKLVLAYQEKYSTYKKILSEYNQKVKENDEINERADFIKYQFNELKSANLSTQEEADLHEEEHYLKNYTNVETAIHEFREIYEDKGALDLIYESLQSLAKLKEYDKNYQELYSRLEEAYYNISDISSNSLFKKRSDDFDEARLDEVEERLSLYSTLKRKYKKTTEELVEYYQKLSSELELITNFDDIIKDLKKKLDSSYQETYDIALKLREERVKYATLLEEKVIENLKDLELKNTSFKISFDGGTNFNKDGIDTIDFLVSFNKGEVLKPLSKVASGGEMSRFMLALKVVIGANLPQQTKIFDEIDSGVSGSVAHSIALKIKEISKLSQVLCITHLAQVASVGDNHIKISKGVSDNRTYTITKTLAHDERILELASMISNGNVTNNSINLAKELLEK